MQTPIVEIQAEAARVSAPLSEAEIATYFGGDPSPVELRAWLRVLARLRRDQRQQAWLAVAEPEVLR